MRRFISLFVVLLLVVGGSVASAQEGAGRRTEYTLTHKGTEYRYYLYLPQNLPADAPLLMVFHGYNSRNIPSVGYGFEPIADKEGFAICYPCGPKDHKGKPCWMVGYEFHAQERLVRDDVGFAVKLVKHLQKRYNLSDHNVFATGHSNGGAMSYILAYQAPKTFAAVASVSGHIMECTYRTLRAKQPIPLMEVHGTDDTLSRWNGDPYNNDGWGADIATSRAVGYWAAVNRCTHEQREELPLIRNQVIAHRYVGGVDGIQVWFYEVVGGKHSWADKDMNTAAEIWKFFSLYLK